MKFIASLPYELQVEIGQYLGIHFPLDFETAKKIINHANVSLYYNVILKADNVSQLRMLLRIIKTFDMPMNSYIKDLLILSIKHNAINCLEHLIYEYTYDPEDLLIATINQRNLSMLKFIASKYWKIPHTVLRLAIENDDVEAVKILTDAETYPYVSDIDMPIRNRNYEMVKILSKFNRSNITPLITAMEIGDVKIMELLLENNRGRWPNAANVARKKGDIPMYNLLLKHGFICS